MKIDVEQARKRAKELVKAGRVAKLADAQREVARELGYPSWPAMVHALEPPTAERVIREADHRPDRALELLAEAPALREDPWVALTLGDASGIRDARSPGGPLGLPPLFYVARSRLAVDNLPAARDLLERGADPNGPGGEEWTNLSIACARGDAPLARLLLESGASPTTTTRSTTRSSRRTMPARGCCSSTARRCRARMPSGTPSTMTASIVCACCSSTAARRTRRLIGRRSNTP